MDQMIARIRTDLENSVDEATRGGFQRFFKEEVKCYGVKSAAVEKIARKYWPEIKLLGKQEIFRLCEELFASDYCEEAFIVATWLPKLKDQFERRDLALFEEWISRYVNNWAKCDSFCNHTIGDFVEKFPESITEIKSWGKSQNRWLKRASAVSLIVPAKRGMFLDDVFEIADQLIEDQDDMVQKGYGWLLKEAGRVHQQEVFDYVMRNKRRMPRTALRYAIELMPPDLKSQAMSR